MEFYIWNRGGTADDVLDAVIRAARRGVSCRILIDALGRVDRRVSIFGTVNFDMRSLWLNYEVALFVYDQPFTEELRALQLRYLDACVRLDPS